MEALDDLDEIGRRAGAALREHVHRRIDTEAALASVLGRDADVSPLRGRVADERRTRAARWIGVAAVLVVAIAGGIALAMARDDDPREVVPAVSVPDPSTPDPSPIPATTIAAEPTAAPTTTAPVAIAPVAIGDSVMAGAADVLAAAGFVVDAHESRQGADLVTLLADRRAAGQLGPTVVIQVGTNGAVSDETFDAMMTSLPPELTPQVVVLTVVGSNLPWIDGNNERIRALPARFPNVTVADWASIAPTVDLCPDGAHISCNGEEPIRAYVNLILDALGRPDLIVPPPTPTTLAPTTTEIILDRSVDALAAFPDPPVRTPSLDDVPTLLPSLPIPGADGARRTEGADGPAMYHDYVQTWVAPGAPGTLLTVETNLDQVDPTPGRAIELGAWDRAIVVDMAPGYASIRLQDPSGYVVLWSRGLAEDDLVSMAESMTLRGGRAGWEVAVPTGLVAVHEGWGLGGANRTLQWTGIGDAEMWISHGNPTVFAAPFGAAPTEVAVVGIGGAVAVTHTHSLDDEPVTAVAWSPAPDITVLLAIRGTAAEAVEIARSVAPVDLATWEAASQVDTSDNDGCTSAFFC